MKNLGINLKLINVKTLGAVHTHTHTQVISKNEINVKLNHKEKCFLCGIFPCGFLCLKKNPQSHFMRQPPYKVGLYNRP